MSGLGAGQASAREDVALSKRRSISSAPELARKPAVAVQVSILAFPLERRVSSSRQGADQRWEVSASVPP